MNDYQKVIQEVAAERQRQIDKEGYSKQHDMDHDPGELSGAGAAYALNAACMLYPANGTAIDDPTLVGFPKDWEWKPKEPRRDLIRAAALLVAEIERIDTEAAAHARYASNPTIKDEPSIVQQQLERTECHGLDNELQVFFYEQDFYVLSNFSAFMIEFEGVEYRTSEHAYQCQKFDPASKVHFSVRYASSAHEAFKLAEFHRDARHPDWDSVKVDVMRNILHAKAAQHEYVRRKLLATGNRTLIENSWRDDFWGWGPNKDGKNMLGKLWKEVREELRDQLQREQEASAP